VAPHPDFCNRTMLRLYDWLEEFITLGRERINNRPSDKEIACAQHAPPGSVVWAERRFQWP
jgi:hypothetical protein